MFHSRLYDAKTWIIFQNQRLTIRALNLQPTRRAIAKRHHNCGPTQISYISNPVHDQSMVRITILRSQHICDLPLEDPTTRQLRSLPLNLITTPQT